jgi:acyl-coenzyme A thioesterase PaaI-like protein
VQPSRLAARPETAPPEPHHDSPPPGTVLAPHYARCFACGDAQPHGLQLAVTVGEGVSISARFTVTDDHQGAPGLAHGGVLATAFDEAMGALLWLIRTPGVTGRLETTYTRPVPVGSTLHIAARCTGIDGRKIYADGQGRLDAPDGPLAVRASALFIAVPLEHFIRHGRWSPEEPGLQRLAERFESGYNP